MMVVGLTAVTVWLTGMVRYALLNILCFSGFLCVQSNLSMHCCSQVKKQPEARNHHPGVSGTATRVTVSTLSTRGIWTFFPLIELLLIIFQFRKNLLPLTSTNDLACTFYTRQVPARYAR